MKVLVCGGRDFNDAAHVFVMMTELHQSLGPFTCVVHGAARGADTLAGIWAKQNDIEVREYPADWRTHGRAAGVLRNRQMLDAEHPDLVIAFPGGRGTDNMVKTARELGFSVIQKAVAK